VSKQIWECIGAFNELASHRPVSLTWVPAHSGIPGNEQADYLAKTASCQPYIGPEPALPMPYNAVKTAIRQWAYVQANNRWQNIKTCRQAKLIIQDIVAAGLGSCSECLGRNSDLPQVY